MLSPDIARGVSAFSKHPNMKDNEFRIFLHGTPRQWQDTRRPWLGVEKEAMAKAFEASQVNVHVRYYDRDMEPSLEMHFKVLENFDWRVGNRGCAE